MDPHGLLVNFASMKIWNSHRKWDRCYANRSQYAEWFDERILSAWQWFECWNEYQLDECACGLLPWHDQFNFAFFFHFFPWNAHISFDDTHKRCISNVLEAGVIHRLDNIQAPAEVYLTWAPQSSVQRLWLWWWKRPTKPIYNK